MYTVIERMAGPMIYCLLQADIIKFRPDRSVNQLLIKYITRPICIKFGPCKLDECGAAEDI